MIVEFQMVINFSFILYLLLRKQVYSDFQLSELIISAGPRERDDFFVSVKVQYQSALLKDLDFKLLK